MTNEHDKERRVRMTKGGTEVPPYNLSTGDSPTC